MAYRSGFGSYLGQTNTIFTTSGGESGAGFTGVQVPGGYDYYRLITGIGTAPGCALGNCCGNSCSRESFHAPVTTLGSVTLIPVHSAAAFVHNTIGGGWDDWGY